MSTRLTLLGDGRTRAVFARSDAGTSPPRIARSGLRLIRVTPGNYESELDNMALLNFARGPVAQRLKHKDIAASASKGVIVPYVEVVPLWQFEEWQQRRERFFAAVDELHEKNKEVDPEIIEQEIAEAVRAVRKQSARQRQKS